MSAARWVSVREYAVAFGVSPATVYGMVAARKLPHVRLGAGRGTIRIPADAVPAAEPMPVPTEAAPLPAPKKAVFKHLRL